MDNFILILLVGVILLVLAYSAFRRNRRTILHEMTEDKENDQFEGYQVRIAAIGQRKFFPISPEEYERICAAKRFVIFGLGLEEKIDLVLGNYAEFEQELLTMALKHSIYPGSVSDLLDGSRHLVNRRILNFLSATRLYLDQVRNDFSKLYGKGSQQFGEIESLTSNEYDSIFGYRVMEALRNHIQHNGLPTHHLSLPMNKDEPKKRETTPIRFSVTPSLDVTVLQEDEKFKASVLGELQAASDRKGLVSLTPLVRDFMEALGRVHETLRKMIDNDVTEADATIYSYRERASSEFGDQLPGLSVVHALTDGRYTVKEYLSDKPMLRRKKLMQKNRYLDWISSRYVSSAH